MNKIKQLLLALALVGSLGVATVVPATSVGAINVFKACEGNGSDVCKSSSSDGQGTNLIKTVINTMLYILGAIAVVMIVFSGIRYTTSAGDASRVKAAKDTLMYSVIGLVVAMLAFAIVNFVIGVF